MKRYWRCSRSYQWLKKQQQQNGVNNKRSQSIQSVRHSKQTPHMWPHQKKRSTRGWGGVGGGGGLFVAYSAHLAVQNSIGPCPSVWYCNRPALFDCRLHSEIMDLCMPVVRVWNDVLPQGHHSSGLSPLLFPEIVYDFSLIHKWRISSFRILNRWA